MRLRFCINRALDPLKRNGCKCEFPNLFTQRLEHGENSIMRFELQLLVWVVVLKNKRGGDLRFELQLLVWVVVQRSSSATIPARPPHDRRVDYKIDLE
jgi:hypothetical protein